jgi:hypothetical protein
MTAYSTFRVPRVFGDCGRLLLWNHNPTWDRLAWWFEQAVIFVIAGPKARTWMLWSDPTKLQPEVLAVGWGGAVAAVRDPSEQEGWRGWKVWGVRMDRALVVPLPWRGQTFARFNSWDSTGLRLVTKGIWDSPFEGIPIRREILRWSRWAGLYEESPGLPKLSPSRGEYYEVPANEPGILDAHPYGLRDIIFRGSISPSRNRRLPSIVWSEPRTKLPIWTRYGGLIRESNPPYHLQDFQDQESGFMEDYLGNLWSIYGGELRVRSPR